MKKFKRRPKRTVSAQSLSWRDYYAAQALPAVLTAFFDPASAWESYEDVAKSCYNVADAMLKAKAK